MSAALYRIVEITLDLKKNYYCRIVIHYTFFAFSILRPFLDTV